MVNKVCYKILDDVKDIDSGSDGCRAMDDSELLGFETDDQVVALDGLMKTSGHFNLLFILYFCSSFLSLSLSCFGLLLSI